MGDRRKCQTYAASPAEPGGLPVMLERLRAWLKVFDARQFDAAIERGARAGKLDARAEEAISAHRAGRSREF
jgi:hypothetical protein